MKANIELPNFYFHDYETFGINPAFDRPAQFAGIRTDYNLNIIDEPTIVYCQPASDYLPSPEAVLITGITPQFALAKGICEAEFARIIHNEFSQPNTCILGYNNIRFDDEVSRNIFYRNFYDPYAYSWKHNNSRWDLLDVVRACYALRPEGIEWPTNDRGYTSFRLEDLTTANHINHQRAHDAMSDVYATIEMAKLIKQHQPKLFNYFFKLRNKKLVINLIDIVNVTPLVHVSGMLGSHRGNTTLIAPLAWHPYQNDSVIICDLTGDVDSLINLSAEQIREKLYTKTSDLKELESRIPLKLIHCNKCPIIAPTNTLDSKNAKRLGIDLTLCEKKLLKIIQHLDLIQQKIIDIYNQQPSFNKTHDVDGQIYQGFFDNYDKSLCNLIQQTAPDNLSTINIEPHDLRLKMLFFRYKARNYPFSLTEKEQLQWRDYCRDKLNHETLTHYLVELENLAIHYQLQPKKMELLKALYQYCQSIV